MEDTIRLILLALYFICFSILIKRCAFYNPCIYYVGVNSIIYFVYVASGNVFINSTSMYAEILYFAGVIVFLLGFAAMFLAYRTNKGKDNITMSNKLRVDANEYVITVLVYSGVIIEMVFLYLLITEYGYGTMLVDTIDMLVDAKYSRITTFSFAIYILENILMALLNIVLPVLFLKTAFKVKTSYVLFGVAILTELVYALSTGSRSPFANIAIILLFPTIYVLHNDVTKRFGGKAFLFVCSTAIVTMVFITNIRTERENTSDQTLMNSFGIVGYNEKLLEHLDSLQGGKLVNTVIVYLSGTFNNYVINYELAQKMPLTYGIESFYCIIRPLDYLGLDLVNNMKGNDELWRTVQVGIYPAAAQWCTQFGSLVKDFGMIGGILVNMFLGTLCGRVYMMTKSMGKISMFAVNNFLIVCCINAFITPIFASMATVFSAIVLIIWMQISKTKRYSNI